jgi:hypothetical protein
MCVEFLTDILLLKYVFFNTVWSKTYLTNLIKYCVNTKSCNDMKPSTQYEETSDFTEGVWYELHWVTLQMSAASVIHCHK